MKSDSNWPVFKISKSLLKSTTSAIGEAVQTFPFLRLSSHCSPILLLLPILSLSTYLLSSPWYCSVDRLDERTAAAGRAARNAYSTVTLAAHEICKDAYPDPDKLKDFLELASKDWYNPDYHVYFMMYLSFEMVY